MSERDVFVARQPIFNRSQRVIGYELLFRSGLEKNVYQHHDGDAASSKVIDSSLNVVGLAGLTAHKPAFINITRKLLVGGDYTVLPPQGVVLELLETVAPDAEVVAACAALKEGGYKLALDDFVAAPEYDALTPFADYIKVDFRGTPEEERKRLADRFGGGKTTLLAEKVETNEEFEHALTLGYQCFQGYFFCKPQIIAGRSLPASKLSYVRFLAALHQGDADFGKLEEIVKSDVAISTRLLRYINSALLSLRAEVNSIRHALALMGEQPLRRWASLIALHGLSDDKPAELLVTCLVRARFCESLAPRLGMAGRELDLFLMGLLSALDALTDQPLEKIIPQMPVAQDVADALCGASSRLGKVYALALHTERGEWEQVESLSADLELDQPVVGSIYRTALDWADQTLRAAA